MKKLTSTEIQKTKTWKEVEVYSESGMRFRILEHPLLGRVKIADHGSKLSRELSEILSPVYAEKYQWRQ